MPDRTQDRFGMTLSTSSTASVDAWQDGIDRLLSQNHGPDLKFQEAIDLDEGFALAHGCLAYWYQQRARPEEARETIKQALALASGVTRRERQQIEAVSYWIKGQGRDSIPGTGCCYGWLIGYTCWDVAGRARPISLPNI